jgi:recombination protein RecA
MRGTRVIGVFERLSMKEEDRRRAIQLRLCRPPGAAGPSTPIPSGIATLDAALGGGFPRGRLVELFGPPSVGKTELALHVLAHTQRNTMGAAWIDADRTFDPAFAASLGVALERLAVALPESAEQALEMARSLAASSAVDLLVIDSVAALAPMLELSAPVGDSGPGLQARVLSSGFRRLAAVCARAGATVLALNQTRGRLDSDAEETTAGGPSLRLYAAVRIALSPVSESRVRFRILKNNAGPESPPYPAERGGPRPFKEGEWKRSERGGFSKCP